ncbi:MAG: helix-turn-helix transcriptional regulator [Eubacteriales bacterium]
MNVNLSEAIHTLRLKKGVTQEKMASSIGVSAQAVSKWERGEGLPDPALLPSIANYFGVTIDRLFGYVGNHEKKIDAILAEETQLAEADKRAQDVNLDRRLTLLRTAQEEFPENERIMLRLADTLHSAGYTRRGEAHDFRDGYHVMNTAYNRQNPYWQEAIALYEHIAETSVNPEMRGCANRSLIYLYGSVGEWEKAKHNTSRLPDIHEAREIVLTRATEGRERAAALGNAILALTLELSNCIIEALMNEEGHFSDPALPIATVKNTIALYDLIFTDGNYGEYHAQLALLYLYLSQQYWPCGMHDEAFAALDAALTHAEKFDSLWKTAHASAENGADGASAPVYSAPLLDAVKMDFHAFTAWDGNMASTLPETWPFWCIPDYRSTLEEIQKDPRWEEWTKRARG